MTKIARDPCGIARDDRYMRFIRNEWLWCKSMSGRIHELARRVVMGRAQRKYLCVVYSIVIEDSSNDQ